MTCRLADTSKAQRGKKAAQKSHVGSAPLTCSTTAGMLAGSPQHPHSIGLHETEQTRGFSPPTPSGMSVSG